MGRIKSPAGSIFRREAKPGYMIGAKAVQGKNWNLGLDDAVKMIGAAEQLYTSPLVRDVVGGVGEIGAGIAGLFDTDDEEEVSVEEAAAASLKAAQEKHAKVRKEEAATMAMQPPVAPPTYISPGKLKADIPSDVIPELTEPELLRQREVLKTRPPTPPVQTSQYIYSDDLLDRQEVPAGELIWTITDKTGKDKKVSGSREELEDQVDQWRTAFLSHRKVLNNKENYIKIFGEEEGASMIKRAEYLIPILEDKWFSGTAILEKDTAGTGEEPPLVPTGYKQELATPAGIQPGALEGVDPRLSVPPAPPVREPIVAPAPSAEVPVAAAEVAPRAYPPEILEKPLSRKELAAAGKMLESQGIHDLSDVRQMMNTLPQIPGLASQVSGVPTEQRPQFLADMAVLVSQLTPATPAPAAGIDKFRIEPGMNLGQAQAIAAHLANVGGTQADLATLLEDVENITGVSSVEGGFGRWVAGGRSGGYFMDPGMAATAVKKAYDTGTAARTSGQSKALMDAYRRAQIAKIATGEERKERQLGLKTRKTEQAMLKTEQDMALKEAKFKYNFPVELYKKWLDVATKQVDLAGDILEKGKRKQKPGVRTKALTDYRNMIKSGADDIQKFARSSMKKLDNDKEKLNATMARIGKSYKGIETADLTQDEIIALYGSDMRAYRQDMRGGEELTEQEIADLKRIMQRRINTIISKSSRLMPMTERMTKLQKDIYQVIIGEGTRLQKKKKIDGYNKELMRLRNEFNKLIGGWETK